MIVWGIDEETLAKGGDVLPQKLWATDKDADGTDFLQVG